MDAVENFIEMLYDDSDKLRAASHLMELSCSNSNLGELMENEVLIGALTRLFREESRKNFELAINIATIFSNFSQFANFHLSLSRYKIGGLTMQLIEHELKRWDLWKDQIKESNEGKSQRRLDFAMRKQNQLVTICLNMLLNLADELKVEYKMVKRGILPILAKCLEHISSLSLLLVTCNFLWKLSVFNENRLAMDSLGVVEKCVNILPNSSLELSNAIFSLMFNLSFEKIMCKRMVSAGLINFLATCIDSSDIALNLLYQLSIVEDAKAMIAFTNSIRVLLRILFESKNSKTTDVVKALLINMAMEKRNAQLICSANGTGLNSLMSCALENNDLLMMKIVYNISLHGNIIQEMFIKWLPQLLENVTTMLNPFCPLTIDKFFGLECLRIATNVPIGPWPQLDDNLKIIDFLQNCLANASNTISKIDNNEVLPDDILLQVVCLCGTLCQRVEMARRVLTILPHFIPLMSGKLEDDEFMLQIVYVFMGLISHAELATELCSDDSQVVEYMINLMHDKNHKLRLACDQALQIVLETNKNWSKRISEERFRWHNIHWLEMVVEGGGSLDGFESIEQFDRLILDADEILGGDTTK